MQQKRKPDDGLIETGKPDDPAKQDNPDTRPDQERPFNPPEAAEAARKDGDPALETTREAGQGGA